MSCSTCPYCGRDLEALRSFSVGSLGVEQGGTIIWWNRHRVPLRESERLIVTALAKADGAPMRKHVLADVIGYDGDRPDNLVSVHVSRAKARFQQIDPSFDRIESIRGAGLRWKVEEMADA